MQTHKVSRLDRERQAMREANELPQPSIVDIDPEDPTQRLDDVGQFSIVDVDVDAQPQAEANAAFDEAQAESTGEDTTADAYDASEDTREDESFADSELGEHAFETLGKKMVESGAEPERELDIIDDSDAERSHHKSDTRDRPVSDKGFGGRGGAYRGG